MSRIIIALLALQVLGALPNPLDPPSPRTLVGDLNAALAALKTCKESLTSLGTQIDSSVRVMTGEVKRDSEALVQLLKDNGLINAGEQTSLNGDISATSSAIKVNGDDLKVKVSGVSDLVVQIEADIGDPFIIAGRVPELENALAALQTSIADWIGASEVDILAIKDKIWAEAEYAIEAMLLGVKQRLSDINAKLAIEEAAVTVAQRDLDTSGEKTVASLEQYLTHF